MESRADELRRLLPVTLPYDKFSRVVYDALNRDPKLAGCTPASVVNACAAAARDGLILDGREAALVVFRNRDGNDEATYIPMVAGIRKRIFNSGLVSAMQTGVVYRAEIDAGRFEYEAGTEGFLRHRPDLLWSPDPNEDPAAAYSLVSMKDGGTSVEVMKWSEIKRVWGLLKRPNPLHNTHKIEMARKTVLRRHAKSLPFSSDMFGADDEADVIEPEAGDAPGPAEQTQGRQRGAGAAAVARARATQEIPEHDQDGVIAETTPVGDDAERDHLPEDDEVF
jgi:recombination protein RecT